MGGEVECSAKLAKNWHTFQGASSEDWDWEYYSYRIKETMADRRDSLLEDYSEPEELIKFIKDLEL